MIYQGKAIAKYQRVSPRKTRLVAKNIVNLEVNEALNVLQFTPNKPAAILLKVLNSALNNAVAKGLEADQAIVKEIVVNEGPTWKRFMPRAQGRATKIHKRTSHIKVIVAGEGQD